MIAAATKQQETATQYLTQNNKKNTNKQKIVHNDAAAATAVTGARARNSNNTFSEVYFSLRPRARSHYQTGQKKKCTQWVRLKFFLKNY